VLQVQVFMFSPRRPPPALNCWMLVTASWAPSRSLRLALAFGAARNGQPGIGEGCRSAADTSGFALWGRRHAGLSAGWCAAFSLRLDSETPIRLGSFHTKSIDLIYLSTAMLLWSWEDG